MDEFEEDLGPADGAAPADDGTPKKAREWGMWVHLSNLVHYVAWPVSIVAPIVLWQIKKDELPGVDAHGKRAVNWAISYSIYLIASGLLCLILIGIPLLIAVVVCGVVFPIMAGIKANNGVEWEYPLCIRFLR